MTADLLTTRAQVEALCETAGLTKLGVGTWRAPGVLVTYRDHASWQVVVETRDGDDQPLWSVTYGYETPAAEVAERIGRATGLSPDLARFQEGWRDGARWQRTRIREAYRKSRGPGGTEFYREQLETLLRDDETAEAAR